MSVVESKREEGELRALTKARELAVYTIRICCNENNFPKRYRWCITNKVKQGEMTREKADECYKSWRAHASKGNSHNLLKSMDRYYKSLWEENVYETRNS